jgi:hypothetical protein
MDNFFEDIDLIILKYYDRKFYEKRDINFLDLEKYMEIVSLWSYVDNKYIYYKSNEFIDILMKYVPYIRTVNHKNDINNYFHYSTLQEVLKHYNFHFTEKSICCTYTYEKIRLMKPL